MANVPDVMMAAKNVAKVVLENDTVRVLEFLIRAGEKAPMHNHPHDYVVYFMSNAKFRMTDPDGKSEDLDTMAGQAMWMWAGSHETINVGKTDGRYLIVELKTTSEEAASLSDSS